MQVLIALILLIVPVEGAGAQLSLGSSAPPQPSAQQAAGRRVEGTVLDSQGLPIPGARITLVLPQSSTRQTVASPVGAFTLGDLAPGAYELYVEASGFQSQLLPVDVRSRPAVVVEVRLEPAALTEQVVVSVTKTEQRLGNLPASVAVLSAEDIRQSPAVVADDVLRQIPTFSLFRRASSIASHPTTQGVSLRGIGPSGVSRTLVLLDGVPLNDAFGGWVYWSRIPLEDASRIEVVDGSSSSLYGNYGMGGVISIVTRRTERRALEIEPQYGNRNSPRLAVRGAAVRGRLSAAVDSSLFSTGGFPIVAATERGRVDTNATAAFQNVGLKLEYNPSSNARAFARGGYFHEKRDNGKVSTIDGTKEGNSTNWRSASGGVQIRLPNLSDLEARVFVDSAVFESNYLAVPQANPPRSVGRMTLIQRVPTTSVGGSAQWSMGLGRRQFVAAGSDWRWVRGDSMEDALDAATGTQATLHRVSGGTQQSAGVFAQDIITPTERLELTANARMDYWRNYAGHNLETTVSTGLPTAADVPSLRERRDAVVNARVAAIYHFGSRASVWGSLGSGFRAPTLNELYRQFRVGSVLTMSNAQLGPERLVGHEAGVNIAPARSLVWRTTWFDDHVTDPVSNVTVITTPTQVTQQRQNLGKTRIRGVQTDVDYRPGGRWRLSAAYAYEVAKVVESASNPGVVGLFLPQVPKHRGSAQVANSSPRYGSVAVGVRFVSRQFDDDQNTRSVPGQNGPGLPKYMVADVTASRVLARHLDVFAAVQNLFDQAYYVGTLPTTIGSPRLVHAGIRLRLGPRED